MKTSEIRSLIKGKGKAIIQKAPREHEILLKILEEFWKTLTLS